MKIKCIRCGDLIEFDHPNRKYCSDCKKEVLKNHQHVKYQKNPWYKKKLTKGKCVFCGKSFLGTWANRQYCSKTCRAEMRKLRRYQESMAELVIKIEKVKKQQKR